MATPPKPTPRPEYTGDIPADKGVMAPRSWDSKLEEALAARERAHSSGNAISHSGFYGSIIPANLRAYAEHKLEGKLKDFGMEGLTSGATPITELPERLHGTLKEMLASAKKKGKKPLKNGYYQIDYDDYGEIMEGVSSHDIIGGTDKRRELFGEGEWMQKFNMARESFKNPKFEVLTLLGNFGLKENDDGSFEVKDTYDFNEKLKKKADLDPYAEMRHSVNYDVKIPVSAHISAPMKPTER